MKKILFFLMLILGTGLCFAETEDDTRESVFVEEEEIVGTGGVEADAVEVGTVAEVDIPFLRPIRLQEAKGRTAIRLEADVKNADVYINGVFQGKTNLTVENLVPGEFMMTLKKRGYENKTFWIEVKKDLCLTYRVSFK